MFVNHIDTIPPTWQTHFPKHTEELCLIHVKTILISTAPLNNPSANQFNYTRDRGL